MPGFGAFTVEEKCRRRRGLGEMGVQAGFVYVVEESEEPVVVALPDRVVLVVVTTGALDSQTQEGGTHRLDPIRHVFGAKFLLDAPALVRLAVQAVKCGRQPLLVGGARDQVAGKLPGDEPVVGQVLVEGADNPISPRRHVAVHVRLISVCVGVAGKIQPVAGHALAVMRRGQEPVDQLLVRIRGTVGEKRVHLRQAWRQAREILADTADQPLPRSLR